MYSARHGNGRLPENMCNLRVAQTRSVILKRQLFFALVEAEASQAVGVGKLAETAQLFWRQGGLQFVSDFHECHARHYSSPAQAQRSSKPRGLDF
jgi:hypothetical protein